MIYSKFSCELLEKNKLKLKCYKLVDVHSYHN